MQFELVHEVGNRSRYRTKTPMSAASAAIIADDLEHLEGVTGLRVNPRIGSVVVTVESLEARARVCERLAGYRTNPPVRRHATAQGRADLQRARRAQAAERVKAREITERLGEKVDSLMGDMPIAQVFRGLKKVLFAGLASGGGRQMPPAGAAVGAGAVSGGAQGLKSLIPTAAPKNDELDFGPLARFVFLRPLLPMGVNQFNAVMGSLPRIFEGAKALIRGKLNVLVLDAAALLVSLLRRDFRTAGLLVVLLGLGEMLENYTRKRSMEKLADELALKVNSVWVRQADGSAIEKPLKEITLEDTVVVRAGSAIPVDGIVEAGEGEINQASMTGEALPVRRSKGGAVFAGTVLEAGEIDVRPTSVGEGTRLSRIVDFIETSEKAKAGIQGKAERWADKIVPYHFLLAGLTYLITRDFNRTAGVLMVDFSCALRLATPLAILTAMRTGTHNGVVVKGGRYLEALSEVDTVVFDKTGTLTESAPKLSRVVSLDSSHPENEILRLSACLEEHFPHPVGRAVVRAAHEKGLDHFEETHDAKIEYIVAHGIASSVDGVRVVLGSRHFVLEDEKVDVSHAAGVREELAQAGLSILYLAVGGRLVGLLGIEDPVRKESAQTIEELRRIGIKRVVMLTGDDQKTAAAVAARLGITEFRAGILPHEKAATVQQLKAEGCKVLMIGDGVNDSPALSAADVGVTLADGADIAREVADVVLVGNDLTKLVDAVHLGRAAMKRIRQNFVVSIGLNSVFLTGGLTGTLTPALGALLHNGTTIGVCLNAMRDPHDSGWNLAKAFDNAAHALTTVKEGLEKIEHSAKDADKNEGTEHPVSGQGKGKGHGQGRSTQTASNPHGNRADTLLESIGGTAKGSGMGGGRGGAGTSPVTGGLKTVLGR